jgi:hypothetical protein
MRAVVAFAMLGAAGLILTACGGGNPTLRGKFIETMYGDPSSRTSCASQEFDNNPAATWKIQIATDDVDVGTTALRWQGDPNSSGSCTATWSMTVPPAEKAYQITLIATCSDAVYSTYGSENIASTTVQPSAVGQPITLSDAGAGGNNC